MEGGGKGGGKLLLLLTFRGSFRQGVILKSHPLEAALSGNVGHLATRFRDAVVFGSPTVCATATQ